METNMENIKNLLNQITIISEKNNAILDATGARFNMFKVCGVNHYENRHSAILAEFLNPNGTHGLKSKLLASFVNMFCNEDLKSKFIADNAKVITEYSMENGRIDILIKDVENHVIIIENKIYAEDQREQLKRYDTFAQKEYKIGNYQILYLTLWGNDAKEHSGGRVDYQSISYQTDIIVWLEKCLEISVRFPMVRETINQYINHLKSLTNQSTDMIHQKEIVDIMTKKENVNAVFDINENFNSFKEEIAKKFFALLRDKKGLTIKHVGSLSMQYGGVHFQKKEKFTELICLQFTSSNFRNLKYGFLRDSENKPSTEFEKYLEESKDGANNSWWAWEKKTEISFTDEYLKQIAEGDFENSENFKQCLSFIDELLGYWEKYSNPS